MGYREPELKGLSTTCGSGFRLAVVSRDAAVTAPCVSKPNQKFTGAPRESELVEVPRVKKNCYTFLRVFAWKFAK